MSRDSEDHLQQLSQFETSTAASMPNRNRKRSVLFAALALTTGCGVAFGGLSPLPAQASSSTIISDSMTRTISSGWGTSTNGVAYAVNNAERFAVTGDYGAVSLEPGKLSHATAAVQQQDVQVSIDVSFDSVPDAGSAYAHLSARQSSNGEYTASLRLLSTGKLSLELSKTVQGTKTVLASKQIAGAAEIGKAYHIDLLAQGNNPTQLKARAYVSGGNAPAWQLESRQGANSGIANKGSIRLGGYLSGSAAKASGLHFDNFMALSAPKAVVAPTPDIFQTPTPKPTPKLSPKTSPDLPSNSLYVSPSGSDAASGSASAPMRSISKAMSMAKTGQTIVVRGGSYHESVAMPAGKTLHLRNYPGETVWLDGSEVVSGFTASGNGWVKSGWKHKFDSSPTYTRGAKDNTQEAWGFINSDHPMAAHPEQVWIDGTRQTQVGSRSALKAGTFYVDTSNQKLYLGSNPAGKSVRASTLVKALSIRGDNSSVTGINVRKYAPSVPDMGAVTAEKPGVTVRDLTIEDSATTGLNVSAVKNTVKNVKILRSGMLGMNAVYSDGLTVDNLISTGNNHERFNTSPVSGGLKIGRTRGVTVKNSTLNNNYGPGLWLDESIYDSKVLNNDMIGNTGHGLSLEISAKSMVANNRIVRNSGYGIKLNNTSDVSIWNNTISGKNRVLNIVQDARRGANKKDPGHDPRQAFPDRSMTWIIKNIDIKNNVLSNTGGGNAIVAVEDYSGSFSAEQMKISMDSNAYHRPSSGQPEWSVVWSKGAGNPAVYSTLKDFVAAKPQGAKSFELTASSVIGSDNDPTSAVTGKNSRATALPGSIAQLIGQSTGAKRIGNFPR